MDQTPEVTVIFYRGSSCLCNERDYQNVLQYLYMLGCEKLITEYEKYRTHENGTFIVIPMPVPTSGAIWSHTHATRVYIHHVVSELKSRTVFIYSSLHIRTQLTREIHIYLIKFNTAKVHEP